MDTDPPLNGEFMRESTPAFDWELDSMNELQARDGRRSGAATASETAAEVIDEARQGEWPSRETREARPLDAKVVGRGEAAAPHHDGGLTSIGLVLNKLAAERDLASDGSS